MSDVAGRPCPRGLTNVDMFEEVPDDHTFKPTAAVANQAAKGLELRGRFKWGGTEVGVARARGLKNQREP